MATLSTLALLVLLARSGDPEWHANLEEAFTRATATGQPLLIVFR